MVGVMKNPMIIDAWLGQKTERLPLWLMRQAGRYLPEYRALREKAGSFLNLCFTPEWASEVTLQPLQRFDLDAAILFSDILVVPHALGQALDFVEGEGPKLAAITSAADLSFADFENRIAPVLETVATVRGKLAKDKALIGFAGSPWTVASYMIHGSGGHDFGIIKTMMRDNPAGFSALITLLQDATIRYLDAQIKAGAQAVQLFESWAGILAGEDFQRWVIQPNQVIIRSVRQKHPGVPVIAFPRGCTQNDLLDFAAGTGINAIGISQDVDPAWAAINLQDKICVQGNLDPALLLQGGSVMEAQTAKICAALGHGPFVFNLGHGVIKETSPDHVTSLVDLVHGFKTGRVAA